MNICMCDVGDGLNLFINHDMMVDFGGEKEKLKYRYHHRHCRYCYPFHHVETFVLSHFHLDHYNGLFLKNIVPPFFDLVYVYYQGIPMIVDKNGTNIHTKFLSYLMAMNHYMLGDRSGLASADLINRLKRLSNKSFSYAPLFKGDIFEHQGKKYEVLWPPRVLETENKIVTKIQTAIKDFETAKEANKELRELAEKYNKIAEKYAQKNEDTDKQKHEYPNDTMQKEEVKEELEEIVSDNEEHKADLSEVVKQANESLRKAANDLSLAFKTIENELLFMGDLETNQINILCDELNGQDFKVFVTPHHGTHAGGKMKQISSKIALSSVGKLYSGYLKNKYLKDVSNHLYCTKKDGCLVVYINNSSLNIDTCKHDFEEISWR